MSYKSKSVFPCTQCDFEAQSARQLSRHKAVTHTQNALKCPLCPFVTAYQTNLLRHRKDVHGICGSKGNKSCKFCGFLSEDNETLIQHQIEFHQDILKTAQLKFAKELVSAGGNEEIAELTSNYDQITEELQNGKQQNGSMKKLKTLKMKDVQQKIQQGGTPTPAGLVGSVGSLSGLNSSSAMVWEQLQELLQMHIHQTQLPIPQQSQNNGNNDDDDDEDEDDDDNDDDNEENEDDEDEYDNANDWTSAYIDQSGSNNEQFLSFNSSFNPILASVQTELSKAPTSSTPISRTFSVNDDIDNGDGFPGSNKARLPATKIRRQYSCDHCTGFKTINPRVFLYHRRDVHNLKIKIVECPFCVYACQYVQKLQRHLQLVHKMTPDQITEIVAIVTKRKKGNLKAFKPNDEPSNVAADEGANQEFDNSQEYENEEDDDSDQNESQFSQNASTLALMANNNSNSIKMEIALEPQLISGDTKSSSSMIKSSSNHNNSNSNSNNNNNNNNSLERSALAALFPGQQIEELDEDYAMECLYCQIKFGDVYTAQKHFSKHHPGDEAKNYIQIAPRKTENVQVVTSQKKVFDNDKSLNSCTHCGYKTRWLSELERHVRVHSKEKPFKCSYCDFKSKWKGDLNRHLSRYHPEKTQFVDDNQIDQNSSTLSAPDPETSTSQLLQQASIATLQAAQQPENILKNILTQKKQTIQVIAAVPLNGSSAKNSSGTVVLGQHQADGEDDEEEDEEEEQEVEDDEELSNHSLDSGEEGANMPNANGLVKTYKCSDCNFTCNTASRFHVHFVQHLKTKPFQCSICGHRSNWEWDVTKHIKMKAQRDPAHHNAQPVLIHDSGKRDYSKYDKFVVYLDPSEVEIVNNDLNKIDFRAKRFKTDDDDQSLEDQIQSNHGNIMIPQRSQFQQQQSQALVSGDICSMLQPEVCFTVDGEDGDEYLTPAQEMVRAAAKEMSCGPSMIKNVIVHRNPASNGRLIVCYICGFRHQEEKITIAHISDHHGSKPYACKYCLFDTNFRDIILTHVSDMHKSAPKNDFDIRFRCLVDRDGGCRVLSEQEVDELEDRVLAAKDSKKNSQNGNNGSKFQAQQQLQNLVQQLNNQQNGGMKSLESNVYEAKDTIRCKLCPFLTTNSKKMTIHCRFHNPTKGSLKCKFCPYFVNAQEKLIRHQKLHQSSTSSSVPVVKPKSLMSCPVCPFKTPNTEMYEQHLKLHGNISIEDLEQQQQPKEIPVVAIVSSNSSELELGKDQKNSFDNNDKGEQNEHFHSCNDCPAFFKTENEYKIHCLFHSTNYANRCPFCTYSTSNKSQLSRHLHVHTGEYMNKKLNNHAPDNGENINYLEIAANLMNANKADSMVPPYRLIIPKRPYSPDNAHPGLRLKFTTAPQDPSVKPPRKRTKLEFPIKPVKVKLNSALDGKQKIVFNNDDEVKNQEFVETKEYLSRIRSGIKNRCMYRCADCPAVFTKVNTLIYHTTLHKNKFEHHCQQCSYSSDFPQHVEAHQVLHSLKENQSALGYNFSFNCHKCPAGFSKRARLEKHLTLHGANFNWKCEQCDYSVRYAATLVKHRAIHLINPKFETKPTNSSIPEYQDLAVKVFDEEEVEELEEEELAELQSEPTPEEDAEEDEIEAALIMEMLPEAAIVPEDDEEMEVGVVNADALHLDDDLHAGDDPDISPVLTEGDDEGFEGEQDDVSQYLPNQEEIEMAEFRAALDGEDLEDDIEDELIEHELMDHDDGASSTSS